MVSYLLRQSTGKTDMICTKPSLLKDRQSPKTLVSGIRIKLRVKGLPWRVDCYVDDQQFVVFMEPEFSL
jgi:hypothetical protein